MGGQNQSREQRVCWRAQPEVAGVPAGHPPVSEAAMYKCPYFMSNTVAKSATVNVSKQLNLKVLRPPSYLNDFNYAAEFKKVDLNALKQDIQKVLTTSQDWWPADYGHYGPLMIRLAWHSAGTYRSSDGRGGSNTGNMRFAPLNSWPDNGNLDKARRLLWPIKKKYGKKLSWGDLMILTGNVALEDMGFKTFGFAGGREDIWAAEEDVYWGNETTWLADERHAGGKAEGLEKTLAADHMGLIYVNPEGPGGNPDPIKSAAHIRTTFGRMSMNDSETVALIAGGHTFGKGHGATNPGPNVGPEPEAATIEEQGFGWKNSYGTGKGKDAITSGLEGAWTSNPTKWDNGYFHNLFEYEWECKKGPGGANQWYPKAGAGDDTVPDAHVPGKKHAPTMFTTDVALKEDPIYLPISKNFHENPEAFADAFGKAWYKLCHRDMGPIARCLGPEVPEAQIWQDPVPTKGKIASAAEIVSVKELIAQSGIPMDQLVRTAWASASTYRCTDHRGGANGGRIRLAPQKDWKVNDPAELAQVIKKLEKVQMDAAEKHGWGPWSHETHISIADLIVLGGAVAVEDAAKKAGVAVQVPFTPGRTDASPAQTDAPSFDVLEPAVDAFRNYKANANNMVDRAQLLKLTAPEMSVMIAGLRVLNGNAEKSKVGVLTKTPGTLTNDFFVNLLDMDTTWKKGTGEVFEGRDASGALKWTGSQVDLVFGSNSELRAIAEYYACEDSKQVFVKDFVAAWVKVMNLDRF